MLMILLYLPFHYGGEFAHVHTWKGSPIERKDLLTIWLEIP